MSRCYTEHSFVYVARDSKDELPIKHFVEYYICIDCGDEQTIEYQAGQTWIIPATKKLTSKRKRK